MAASHSLLIVFMLACMLASALSATCTVSDCKRCLSGSTSVCAGCKPPTILFQGSCVQQCPFTHTASSVNASKTRQCNPNMCALNCTSGPSCVPRSNSCTACKGLRYLHQGLCLNECPSSFVAFNLTTFRRQCLARVPANCRKLIPNCLTCNSDTTGCTMCKSQLHLYQGTCFATCPSGTIPWGSGNFHRTCVAPPASVPPCTQGQNHCLRCVSTTNPALGCKMCTDSRFLFMTTCVSVCPVGSTGRNSTAPGIGYKCV